MTEVKLLFLWSSKITDEFLFLRAPCSLKKYIPPVLEQPNIVGYHRREGRGQRKLLILSILKLLWLLNKKRIFHQAGFIENRTYWFHIKNPDDRRIAGSS